MPTAQPTLTFDPALPISGAVDEIRDALARSQVVIVAGETGSGKTTQLPKICLELGRGIRGTSGTPSRAASRRARWPRGSPTNSDPELGLRVGYPVRFTDQATTRPLVKLMTDGILLAEIQRATAGLRATTRSSSTRPTNAASNIRLPRSATCGSCCRASRPEGHHHLRDHRPARFAEHFGGAPIVEVSGRTYPVEIRYRPLEVPVTAGRTPTTRSTRSYAPRSGTRPRPSSTPSGSWGRTARRCPACSCSGEREIRDTADALRGLLKLATPRCCRCTPGCRPPSSTGSSSPHDAQRESCWPPTSPRRP